MAISMKGNGSILSDMDKARMSSLMEIFILVNIYMEWLKAMDNTNGLTATHMLVHLSMANIKEQVSGKSLAQNRTQTATKVSI